MVVLESERLIFRDHQSTDLDAFCEIESDPEYRWPQVVHSRAELERSFTQAWLPTKTMGLLATVLKSDNRYIGRCGLYPRRDEVGTIVEREAEIAYYIGRPYWGHGFATEAARAFVKYGFGTLGLRRIHAGINTKNVASLRVAQKAGFVLARSGEGGGSTWRELTLSHPADTPPA